MTEPLIIHPCNVQIPNNENKRQLGHNNAPDLSDLAKQFNTDRDAALKRADEDCRKWKDGK